MLGAARLLLSARVPQGTPLYIALLVVMIYHIYA